jgi:hypothetical protein
MAFAKMPFDSNDIFKLLFEKNAIDRPYISNFMLTPTTYKISGSGHSC